MSVSTNNDCVFANAFAREIAVCNYKFVTVPLSHMAYDYALQGITSLDEVLRLAEIAK